MAINKVVFGEDTLMDTSGVTVTPETLAVGATALDKTGEQIVGRMVSGGFTLLWENASPTSSFSGQTITVPGLSNYNAFMVLGRMGSSESYENLMPASVVLSPTGEDAYGMIQCTVSSSGAYYIRNRYYHICPSTEEIVFNSAQYGISGSTQTSSIVAVPMYILGFNI